MPPQDTEPNGQFSDQVNDSIKAQAVLIALLGKSMSKSMKLGRLSTQKLEVVMLKMTKTMQVYEKRSITIDKQNRKVTLTQVRMARAMKSTNRGLSRQTRLMAESARNARQMGRDVGRAGIGIRGLLGAFGAFAAFRAVQNIAQQRLRAAVLAPGALEQVRNIPGLSPTTGLETLSGILGASPAAQVGLQSPEAIKGILALQRATIGLGKDISRQVTTDVIKSFGQDIARAQRFTATVNQEGIQAALDRFGTTQNFAIFEQLRNAMALGQTPTADQDPLIAAALATQAATEAVRASAEKLVSQLATVIAPAVVRIADTVGTFNAKELIAGAAIGLVGLKGASVVGKRLLPGLVGLGGAGGAGGAAGAAGAGGFLSVGAAGLTAGFITFAAGLATLGETLHKMSQGRIEESSGRKLEKFLVGDLFKKIQQSSFDNAQQQANRIQLTEVTRIKRTGLEERAREAGKPFQEFAQTFLTQKVQDFAETQSVTDPAELQKVFSRMKKTYGVVEAVSLTLAKSTEAATEAQSKSSKATDKATKAAEKQTKAVKQSTQREKLAKAVQQQQAFALSARELSSVTQIARAQFQLAALSPFGPLGALPELKSLNATIENEIGTLQELLTTIIGDDAQSAIQRNQLTAQILGLRNEQKQANIKLRDAFLNNALGELIGTGSVFEKIIIDRNRNLATGLQQGIIGANVPSFAVGSLTPSRRLPVRPQDLLRGRDLPFQVLDANQVQITPTPRIPQAPTPRIPQAPTPLIPRAPKPQQTQVIQSVNRQTVKAQQAGMVPQPETKRLSPTERIEKRITQREERITRIVSESVAGFKGKGLPDSLRRARQIASAGKNIQKDRERIERIRERTEDTTKTQPKTLAPSRPTEDELITRHPRARKLRFAPTSQGDWKQQAVAGLKQTITAIESAPENDLDVEDRGSRPSAGDSNVIN